MRFVFPLFIIVPIVEMLILIEVGGLIGAFPTIGLVLLTAVIGVNLLRQQGLSTLLKANQKMEQGGLPAEEMVEGLMLAVGGALLLTPGFFTDAVGFALLIPYSRKAMVKSVLKKGLFTMQNSMNGSMGQGAQGFYYESRKAQQGDEAIEGEYYQEIDDRIDNNK